jgi:hypothetical protein
VRDLPEDASYYDRLRLGELVVTAMEQRRDQDARLVLDRLAPFAVDVSVRAPGDPDEVLNAAFLVAKDESRPFDDAVEDVGRDYAGRATFRMLGPLAPYDFVPQE